MDAMVINECSMEMPYDRSNFEEFSNHKNEIKIPFIVYAGTEAILESAKAPVFSVKMLDADASTTCSA